VFDRCLVFIHQDECREAPDSGMVPGDEVELMQLEYAANENQEVAYIHNAVKDLAASNATRKAMTGGTFIEEGRRA